MLLIFKKNQKMLNNLEKKSVKHIPYCDVIISIY